MSLFDASNVGGLRKFGGLTGCNVCNMGHPRCDDFYMHVDPWQEAAEKLPRALDDETLSSERAAARGILVGRLEALYGLAGDEVCDGKDRVRWAELQVRVIDRLIKLWKLDAVDVPAETEDDDSAGIEQQRLRELVSRQLDELAGREG